MTPEEQQEYQEYLEYLQYLEQQRQREPQSESAQVEEASRTPVGTGSQAALEGFGETATLGYLPHIQAGVEGGVDKLAEFLGVGPAATDAQLREQGFDIPERTYVQARDENIARQEQLAEDHPAASLSGKAAGVLASAALPGSAIARASKGAGTMAKIGAGVVQGGTTGALYNPGDEEGVVDPLQLDERLDNAQVGAIAGGAIPAGGATLKAGLKGGKKVAGWFAGMRPPVADTYVKNPKAVRNIRKMMEEGQESALQDKLLEAGKEGLESLDDRITQESDTLEALITGQNVTINPKRVMGVSPKIDRMVYKELMKTQPQYSPLKPNPRYKSPTERSKRAFQGLPKEEMADKPFLPTKPRVDIPTQAELPAEAVNKVRQVGDRGVPYRKGKVLSDEAIAKDTEMKQAADYLRGQLSSQHPDVQPHNETMRRAFQLKQEIQPKLEGAPISTFKSEAPDLIGLLQKTDELGGSDLTELSRQVSAASASIPRGGDALSLTGAIFRKAGRGGLRGLHAAESSVDKTINPDSLQAILQAIAQGRKN